MTDDQLYCALKEQQESLKNLHTDLKELDSKFDKLMIEDLPSFKLDVQKELTAIKVDLAGLKVKTGMFGAIAGGIGGMVLTIISQLVLHFI